VSFEDRRYNNLLLSLLTKYRKRLVLYRSWRMIGITPQRSYQPFINLWSETTKFHLFPFLLSFSRKEE